MNRDNHYEAAFEAFLRGRGVAVVPIDEARRSYLDADEVKSPDFIVVGPHDARLVVETRCSVTSKHSWLAFPER